MMRRIVLLLGLLSCGLAATAWAATDIQIAADLNPANFAADQEAVFTITVNGSSAAQPELPTADGLRFRSLGQSQQTSWVNGQISANVSFSFTVQADKPGQHTIDPVKVQVDGKNHP
ncbi:BatD family protein, partial [Desulfobulbus sp. F3]|nr:BatD family protein [Desulfobulbus sp. F3]